MARKPEVAVESMPGPRGLDRQTNQRWFARAICEGHAATAYGVTRSGAERKAARWAREQARKYRKRTR